MPRPETPISPPASVWALCDPTATPIPAVIPPTVVSATPLALVEVAEGVYEWSASGTPVGSAIATEYGYDWTVDDLTGTGPVLLSNGDLQF